MTSRDFCYWLQGFFELTDGDNTRAITATQAGCIRNHLNMVFKHEIDPSHGDKKHQQELSDAHEGKPPAGPSTHPRRPPKAQY